MSINLIILIFVFILGLVFGSFYNVVGYRVPNNMSIIFPNSSCPKCKHTLKWYELIPVFSYVFQRGRCTCCKEKISIIYPLFELVTATLFAACYYKFGLSIDFVISITFVSILIIITISDFRYYIIPDEVLIFGIVMLLIEFSIKSMLNDFNFINYLFVPILHGFASFALLYLFKIFGDFILKKECLGGGDIKLLLMIGLVIGFDMSIVTVFLASFIALPISIFILIKKDDNVLPFGPYLSLASIIILLTNLNLDIILDFFIK